MYGSSPLAVCCKAWVCGPLFAGIGFLNTVEGMDVSCCQVEISAIG